MRTITLLEQQKRNKERVNIYLDGEFAFGLNLVDAATLRKGQQLSEQDIAELRDKDQVVKAFDYAVNLLSYRPRSIHELRQRMAKKDYAEAAIDAAVARLEKRGYVDDRAFAKMWIEDRNRSKPRGKRALTYELRKKGIAKTIIDDLLETMVDENDAAYEAAQSRIRRMRGKSKGEFKKKIGSFLQRRGFNYDAINQALNQHIAELDEIDPDYFAEDDQPDGW